MPLTQCSSVWGTFLPSFLPALAQQQYLIFQEILIEVPLLGATVQASGAAPTSGHFNCSSTQFLGAAGGQEPHHWTLSVPSGQFKDALEFPEDQ